MSNKSLFNKTLIKKDLKILTPIFLINTIILIFALPFSYSQAVLLLQSDSARDFTNGVSSLYSSYNTISINILVSTITAVMLFASEKSSKSLELLVSLPFSRKQIYFNKIVVGFIVNVLPNIVLHLVSLFIILAEPMTKPFFNFDFFIMYFLNSIAIQIVVFTYFVVISLLFGNIFATVFCGYVFTLIPIGLIVMIQIFLEDGIPSASYEYLYNYTPFFILLKAFASDLGYLKLFGYSIVFIIMGMALFEMTKMEKSSELLTFRRTEIIFRAGVFICCAIFFSIFVQSIFLSFGPLSFLAKVVGFIVGGAFGFFIPNRAITKSRAA